MGCLVIRVTPEDWEADIIRRVAGIRARRMSKLCDDINDGHEAFTFAACHCERVTATCQGHPMASPAVPRRAAAELILARTFC